MALYPPIVASSMPAFDINSQDGVRIYFTLSNYNGDKREDIKEVHVTVRNQASNVNVVNNTSEMLVKSIQQSQLDKMLNRYYVNITSNDLTEGNFSIDKIYKVQLRFSSVALSGNQSAEFFSKNLDKFSEWSTVCIIKPINPPEFYIDQFKDSKGTQEDTAVNDFNYSLAQFTGIFKNTYTTTVTDQQGAQTQKTINSSQVLKSWRLRLYNSNFTLDNLNTTVPLADSKEQISSAYNYTLDETAVILQCLLDYQFQDNNEYKLLFSIKTKNDYEDYKIYSFTYKPVAVESLAGELTTSVNEEQGYIKITFKPSTSENSYIGNLALRRSDSKHEFLNWRDLKNFESHGSGVYYYYDFTVESGIAYKYIIQKRDSRGRRGNPLPDQTGENKSIGTIGEWNHAFLLESSGESSIAQVKQLKLKYDFQVSSYKTNISESKTDTIGSKYPFIRRNGNMYYRSFPITGTITAFMDDAELFVSKSELNDNIDAYDKFHRNDVVNFNVQYDYTYERKFREAVMQFLYDSKPKLYKSMQEGNILIKLMQVSLTPKNQLGRLVYAFSATAYQIGQPTLANLNSYGFIDIGTYNTVVSYQAPRIGQIISFDGDDLTQGELFKADEDIIGTVDQGTAAANSIASKEHYNQGYNNKVLKDFKINYLRIEVQSQPYLIIQENGLLRPFDDVDSDGKDAIDFTNPHSKFYQLESTYRKQDGSEVNIYLGTLFELNGQQIMIAYPNNIYQLKDQGLQLPATSTLIPKKDTVMSFDYVITSHYQEDTSNTPKRIKTQKKVGQIIGTYNYSQQLINTINYKYSYNYYTKPSAKQGLIKQSVNEASSISIDTQPLTVFYAGTKTVNGEVGQVQRFVVNETGELKIDPESSSIYINYFKIYGRTFIKNQLRQLEVDDSITSIDNINITPINKTYCIINNQYYVYYKNNWYLAALVEDDFLDIQCDVNAMLFYTVDIRRDFF